MKITAIIGCLLISISVIAAPTLKIVGQGFVLFQSNTVPAMTIEVSNMDEGTKYTMLWHDRLNGKPVEFQLFTFTGTTNSITTNCIMVPGYDCGFYMTIQ